MGVLLLLWVLLLLLLVLALLVLLRRHDGIECQALCCVLGCCSGLLGLRLCQLVAPVSAGLLSFHPGCHHVIIGPTAYTATQV